MKINGWRNYRHCAMPTTPPHILANLNPIKNGDIFKLDGGVFFVLWYEKFDLKYKTPFYAIIKENDFDFSEIHSSRRTIIRKGLKRNEVKVINPVEYITEIYNILLECANDYPSKYRYEITIENVKKICEDYNEWGGYCIASFSKDNNTMNGYCYFKETYDDVYDFDVIKVPDKYNKDKVVYALIYNMVGIIFRKGAKYILAGYTEFSHETNFKQFLVDNFNFRYSYIDLRVKYKLFIKLIVNLIYPFRNITRKLDNIRIFHILNGILKIEYVRRECDKLRK